jgi:hypothetical protein
VGAMLGPPHADRRQLRDLTAAEPTARPALLGRERTLAYATHIREVVNDLIHLIRRLELPAGATVPGLAALLTTLTLFAHQLLSLRARLRPPLRPRLRRIG